MKVAIHKTILKLKIFFSRQRLGSQRGQRGRGQRRRTPPPVLEEYDDGTDYGGSYSFEDERYGGGGRRRGGHSSYERQTTQRYHSYKAFRCQLFPNATTLSCPSLKGFKEFYIVNST